MSTEEHRSIAASRDVIERRQTPRLKVLEHIHGELRPVDTPVTLLNISYGGFLMQGPINFPMGPIHEFSFTTPSGDSFVLRAQIVHAIRATAGGVASYVVGFEFLDRGVVACEQAIEALLGCL